jgi:hypothetical protein
MAILTSRIKVLSVEGKFEVIWGNNYPHFTSLITFLPLFLEILDFLLTSNSLPFTSLHFTSLHFTFFLKFLGLEGKVPKSFIGSLFQSWMVLFTKEYFPISFLCLLFLIFLT